MEENISIKLARTKEEILRCFPLHTELRPKLVNPEAFAHQVTRQEKHGYILAFIEEDSEVAACIGYRIFENFAWEKIFYIDDLICREKSRRKGYGTALLNFAKEQATLSSCSEIHLDTGHQRHEAHKFYFSQGFIVDSHHFTLKLKK